MNLKSDAIDANRAGFGVYLNRFRPKNPDAIHAPIASKSNRGDTPSPRPSLIPNPLSISLRGESHYASPPDSGGHFQFESNAPALRHLYLRFER